MHILANKRYGGMVAFATVLAIVCSALSGTTHLAHAATDSSKHATTAFNVVSTNQTTHQTPGMAAVGTDSSSLYIGWAGDNPGHHIFVTTANNLNSSTQLSDTVLPGTGVGMCPFNNRAYIIFTGTNYQVYIGWFNGSYYLQDHTAVPGAISYHTPSCTLNTYGSSPLIDLAWTGTDSHLNDKSSADGIHFSPTGTDTGDTANAGIGIAVWNYVPTMLPVVFAFSGTDSHHFINYTNFASGYYDPNNWTNSDVEAAYCCTKQSFLLVTWQAADPSDAIYYETWQYGTSLTVTSHKWIYQSNAGIGVAVQNNCAYFAWGDLNGYLNYGQVQCWN